MHNSSVVIELIHVYESISYYKGEYRVNLPIKAQHIPGK